MSAPAPSPRGKSKPPKPPSQNVIHSAVSTWLTTLSPNELIDNSLHDSLIRAAPKRFTIYEPMALLPTGSFTAEPWPSTLQRLGDDACQALWSLVLSGLSKGAGSTLTHLAITQGIPLHKDGEVSENVMRSPSGLSMLFGAFGPIVTGEPQIEDFDRTLWVSTRQNGIRQTWAPRWTMFSRGNVKEKARVLSFNPVRDDGWAVDLYAGIGYFVFSYARLGYRVLCWEINPWSVEGLRRGALANRWSVRVIQGSDLDEPFRDSGEQIVVFRESNERAGERVKRMQREGVAWNIGHVNCGFLPTSELTWRLAWDVVGKSGDAWLHLHENVGVNDTESRAREIEGLYEGWAATEGDMRTAKTGHIELVKTFAPGVWHCVFDVHIASRGSS